MDARTRWAWGASLGFAAACALVYSRLKPTPDLPAPDAPVNLSAPKAPPSALPAPTPDVTNEALDARLRDQTQELGIKAIGPQAEEQEDAPPPFLRPGDPASRDQAEEEMRQIALLRKAVDRGAGLKEPVPIDGRVAPVLAEEQDANGQAVSTAAARSQKPR